MAHIHSNGAAHVAQINCRSATEEVVAEVWAFTSALPTLSSPHE
jgi:hypothetical protein